MAKEAKQKEKEVENKEKDTKGDQQKKDESRLQEAAFLKANPDKILIYDVKTRTKVPVARKECVLKTVHTKRGDRRQVVGLYRPEQGEPRQVFTFVGEDFKL